MKPPRRRLTAAERREQLLTVARSVFAERGVDGTTVEELAARAGVTKPLIYEHFGSKEGIYQEVTKAALNDVISRVDTALKSATTPEELVRDGFGAAIRFIRDNPEGFRIMHRDSPDWYANGGKPTVRQLGSYIETSIADILRRFGGDPHYAPIYARFIIGSISILGEWWIAEGHEAFTEEDVTAATSGLVWFGLHSLADAKLAADAKRETAEGVAAEGGTAEGVAPSGASA